MIAIYDFFMIWFIYDFFYDLFMNYLWFFYDFKEIPWNS